MTLLAIWAFIKRFVIHPIMDHWKIALSVFAGLVLAVFIFKACQSPAPTIDIRNIDKINSASRQERLEELNKTIQENANVVKTVDGRNTIAETSEAEKQAQIHAKILAADAQIEAAKAQGKTVSGADVDCILTGERCNETSH